MRIKQLKSELCRLHEIMAQPEVSSDPDKLPSLAKRISELEQLCSLADKLEGCLHDQRELEKMHTRESFIGDEEECNRLYKEYVELSNAAAQRLYQTLLAQGYLAEEYEDERDLEILRFIDYAGPEYAWRLGINVGLDVKESRTRLEKLRQKGLLERVQGTMLGNYHRQKDWTKHMNHTYYRISRQGKLYLRHLRHKS